jgi:hypothetical protein
MGLSIHYNGKFSEEACLSQMITEIRDIAEICKWDYKVYNKQFPEENNGCMEHDGELYGISVTPPKCETVSFCFLSNRRMSGNTQLIFWGGADKKPESDYLYVLSVKTQFAGIEAHKIIIQLFRHLEKKGYFEDFSLDDEGSYWETGDEKLLEEKFKTYTDLLDNFSLAIETIPAKKDEPFEKYFERILNKINERKKNSLKRKED